MDILELRHVLKVLVSHRRRFGILASRAVHIIALEDDGLILDVVHHDVGNEQLLRLSTTADATLETQTSVRAREAVVAHHHLAESTHRVAAEHEAAMGMKHRVVLNKDVLTAVGRRFRLHGITLHADAVVACIHHTIHNQSHVHVAEVDGITVLGVPRTADSHPIHHHVLAIARMDMETRRVLNSHSLNQNVLTIGETDEVGTHALLIFRA